MSTATVPLPEPVALSEGERLLDVFIAPSKTFTDLRRNSSWWVPFLIGAVLSLAFVWTVQQKVGFRKVAENQMRQSPKQADRIEKLPADQREEAMARQASFFKGFSYASPVTALVWYALIAVILWATFKFAANAVVSFNTAMAVVIYAGLPLVVRAALAMTTLWAGVEPDSFTFSNPVASNPGHFMDPSSSPALYNLMTSLDVFMIWTLVLTSIGFACVSSVKRSTSMAIVFGWYGFMIIVSVGFAAAFS